LIEVKSLSRGRERSRLEERATADERKMPRPVQIEAEALE
jgi:hypothetical protein